MTLPFNAEVTTTYWYSIKLKDGYTHRITTNYDADPDLLQVFDDGEWVGGAERVAPLAEHRDVISGANY